MRADEADEAFNKLLDFFTVFRPDLSFPFVEFSTLGEGIVQVTILIHSKPKESSEHEIQQTKNTGDLIDPQGSRHLAISDGERPENTSDRIDRGRFSDPCHELW